MWINSALFNRLQTDAADTKQDWKQAVATLAGLEAENKRLREENVRLAANIEWFKLRLNSVERERAQLIFAATGQKISVPEFVPTYEAPETALAEQPDFAAVGEDARGEKDYDLMPERANN